MDPRDHDLMLQRLHDGELPQAEAEALKGRLSETDRQKLGGLLELDELLQGTVSAEGQGIDLWAGLERRLEFPQVPQAQGESHGRLLALGLRRRRGVQMTALAAALAMAATLVFWLAPRRHQTNHCDVESLEVAGGSASVLQIPGDNGDSTTVVWMDHQESDEWESL